MKTKLLAFYLPQYYPTPYNDEWWQPGFTEWTNVAKAKPLFRGHYQPKIPKDLGFYDLRVSETREKQAALAKEYGIDGFCYWHYWFAGRRLLEIPFQEVVESGKPDFPFCLCWANHSWYKKMWNPDVKKKEDILLIEQTYPGKQDYINHFNSLLPAFKDHRYIKDDDGRLLFSIYAGWNFVDTELFFKTWNDLAKENGLKGFRFISYAMHPEDDKKALAKGFDCVTHDFVTMRPNGISYLKRKWKNFLIKYFKKPFLYDYNDYIQVIKEQCVADEHHYPCVIPNFDHSSRSSSYGTIYGNATPEKWEEVLKIALNKENKNEKNRFVFIKAWNEWGEGNYLEPDLKFGRGWLEAVKNAIASAGK